MHRLTLLVCVLALASGLWASRNWDEVLVFLAVTERGDDRAIQLAKSDYSIERTNEVVIQDHIESFAGTEVIGWQAEEKSQDIYLVKFLFTQHEVPGSYYFEVDIGVEFVRNLAAHPALAEKYDVRPATPR